MAPTRERAPAQRGDAGGGIENHVGAGLGEIVPPAADRYLAALDAEAALVGALMHQPAAVVAEALALVHDSDFADLRLSVVAEVCRTLAGQGTAPDPVSVLAHVRREAIVTSVEAVREFSLTVFEVYQSTPLPASWPAYRLAVLDGSLRRRAATLAARVGQAAEHDSIGSLMPLIGREVVAVDDVRRRREAAGAVGS